MNNKNIFKIAIERKFRYPYRGWISTEDLYDLNTNQLDSIFKELNSQIKKTNEESLLNKKSSEETDLDTMIEIVKTVFEEKVEEKRRLLQEKEISEKKQKIMAIINKKQDESLENMSKEELLKMLESME